MKNWINKNYKTLIIAAFLVPIITVAIVSISHVTTWYGISNPVTWSVYLSIGIEIAALSALAAISANMGSKVYFPFAIVTIVQFIGNIFFAYTFIDINSQQFKDWVDLVSPLVEYMGVEPTDFVGHKRFLAFFAGGMLPVISLSFLHMLVKFTEEDRKKQIDIKEEVKETINEIVKEPEQTESKIDASDLVSEISRLRLSENDLKTLEEVLLNPPSPNERLVEAAKRYQEKTKKESELSDDEILKRAEEIKLKKIFEKSEKIEESREEKYGPENNEDEPSALANSQYREEYFEEEISDDSTINEDIVETNDKEKQRELLVQIMKEDEKDGLYDDLDDEPIEHSIEDDDLFHYIPTEEEEQQNFSTIEEDSTNIFHDEEVINETPISVEEKTLNLRQVVFEENTILETPQIEVVSNVEEPQPQPTPLIENEEVEKKNF